MLDIVLMCHREDDGIRRLQRFHGGELNSVFGLGFVRQRQRIVHLDRDAEALSSRTMSTTLELRMSGTFSLKVSPSTVTMALRAIAQ